MKKLVLVVVCITIVYTSCKKDAVTPVKPTISRQIGRPIVATDSISGPQDPPVIK